MGGLYYHMKKVILLFGELSLQNMIKVSKCCMRDMMHRSGGGERKEKESLDILGNTLPSTGVLKVGWAAWCHWIISVKTSNMSQEANSLAEHNNQVEVQKIPRRSLLLTLLLVWDYTNDSMLPDRDGGQKKNNPYPDFFSFFFSLKWAVWRNPFLPGLAIFLVLVVHIINMTQSRWAEAANTHFLVGRS